jgi:hypothetical protein
VESDFYTRIRLTLSILERDVQLVYTPLLVLPEKKQGSGGPAQAPFPGGPAGFGGDPQAAADQRELESGELGRSVRFWGPAQDVSGIRAARFTGTENKLSFVTVSNIRIYKNSPVSEFAKISYELGAAESGDEGQVLTKTEWPSAFDLEDDRDKNKRVYKLLGGVAKLAFKYYSKEKDKWTTSWDSDKEEHRNRYPDIVEVEIDVAQTRPTRLSWDGRYRFRPEVPVNGLIPSF